MKNILAFVLVIMFLSCSKEEEATIYVPCTNVALSNSLVGTWIWEECANYSWGESHSYPGPSEVRLMIFYPNDTVVSLHNGTITSITNYIVADTFHYTNEELLFINYSNDSIGRYNFEYYHFTIYNNHLDLSPDIRDGGGCSYRRCN